MAEAHVIRQPPVFVSHNDLLIAPGYRDALREAGADSLGGLFGLQDAESLGKPGLPNWRQRLRFQMVVGGERRTFYVKRFVDPPAGARRMVRRSGTGARSTAGVEWAWINRLAAEGLPVVEPVAFGEEVVGSRERRSAIVTARVPGESLETWAAKWMAEGVAPVRRLSEALARLAAGLHAKGYVHRDLYLCHVFYDPEAELASALRLIDLQRVKRPTCLRMRWVVKDLASLNYSVPQGLASGRARLRWLKQYLGLSKLDGSARRLAYRVAGKTRRIARHDRRRAREH